MADLTRKQFERFMRERTPCVDETEQATADHCLRERIAVPLNQQVWCTGSRSCESYNGTHFPHEVRCLRVPCKINHTHMEEGCTSVRSVN